MSVSIDVAKAVLIPHGKSHPFTQRECILKEPAKVGRSLAKTKIQANNFIFDCRVLSRNHALIWFQDNKFFIQDTKSSNGTFVNERRLSPTGEESRPTELKSGDVIQFGVNVEGPTKVTHGCIIAIIKLSINGQEYVGPSVHSMPDITIDPNETISELTRILETAFLREQDMENKLVHMHDIVSKAQAVAKDNMLAVVKEDHLLARMRMLENQIQAYSQDLSEDNLKCKLAEAYEEHEKFEIKSKQTIQSIIEEKSALSSQYESIKQEYDKAEQECSHYKSLYEESKKEHILEISKLKEQMKTLEKQCKDLETKLSEEKKMASDNAKSLEMEVVTTKNKLTQSEVRLGELEKECESLRLDREELTTSLSVATSRVDQSISRAYPEEEEDFVQQTIIPESLHTTISGELQVAFNVDQKEDVHDTMELVAKLLTNTAILHACCSHEEDEIKKRDNEIKQLRDLLSKCVAPKDEVNTSTEPVRVLESLHQVTSSSASPPSSPERQSANEGPSQLLVSHSQQVKFVPTRSAPPEETLPLTTMAVLISIGVVIGAVLVGYYF